MSTECIATLTIPGEAPEHFSLPAPTHGEERLDLRILDAMIARFARESDVEFAASCASKISFTDGDGGDLLYRGYPVEQLVDHCDFLEVVYLLMDGELPNAMQKAGFESVIRKHVPVHEQMVRLYEGFRRDADPMAVMVGVVGALSAFHPEAADCSTAGHRSLGFHQTVAKMPAIVAMAYKYSIGLPFMRPRADLGYTANFLYMMFGTPCEEYTPNPVLVRALDTLLILHADYCQDASTSTLRMAGSSGASPFACVSAAIACVSGPSQGGGAACIAMLEEIGDVSRIAEFIARAGNGNDSLRLPGFGQPVHREFDRRVMLMRKLSRDVLKELGLENDRLFRLALLVEKTALEDPCLVEKRLHPNLDFYSGIVLKALGIPPSMFACILALARTAGWIAHWEETLGDPDCRIAALSRIG